MRQNSDNRAPKAVLVLLSAIGQLVACSEPNQPGNAAPLVTAADIAVAQAAAKPTVDVDALRSRYADADLERGRQVWRQCSVCHQVGGRAASGSGPVLKDVFGRSAGALPGFPYSAALREADFVWTPDALDAWLRSPYRFLPGNRMSFGGISRPSDRRDLIAWLLWNATDTD